MKTNLIKKIIFLATLILIILPVFHAYAADNLSYKVLAPLPGIGDKDGTTTLADYIPAVFNLLIGLSAVFAVLMIVIGGFQYMSSDALQGKSDGRNRIENAVKGLVLVIAAYLILFTVNPDLLNLHLSIDPVPIKAPAGGSLGGGAGSPSTNPCTDDNSPLCTKDAATEYKLFTDTQGKITVYADPCIGNQTKGCVNLDGLQPATVTGAVNLSNACNCKMNITGGSEAGHSVNSTHDQGKSLDVEVNPVLNSFILTHGGTPVIQPLGPVYTITINGQKATFLHESAPEHWHMTFN